MAMPSSSLQGNEEADCDWGVDLNLSKIQPTLYTQLISILIPERICQNHFVTLHSREEPLSTLSQQPGVPGTLPNLPPQRMEHENHIGLRFLCRAFSINNLNLATVTLFSEVKYADEDQRKNYRY